MIAKLITSLVIEDFQPISIVQDTAFNNLIKFLAPYLKKIPCEMTIKNNISTLFQTITDDLRKSLKSIDHLSVTCDIWSGKTQDGILNITCSFIDSNYSKIILYL